MKVINTIVFPVDLTEAAEEIVPYVRTMADRLNARIHLLYIVRGLKYYTHAYLLFEATNDVKRFLESAQEDIEAFRIKYFKDFPDTIAQVVTGNAQKILNHIGSGENKMIIMGARGHAGWDTSSFGSVGHRIVKTAPIPVMVVNTF